MSELDFQGDAQVCVVVDTNVWRSSQLLREPVSAAFLYTLRRLGGRLGIPEVVEREVLRHGSSMGREAREEVERHLRTIRALTGSTPGLSLPTDNQFFAAAKARLDEIGGLVLHSAFTLDLAVRALDRVDFKRPPASKSQQYKDCVIWETCLDLAESFDVHLITHDKAFFDGFDFKQGLDRSLAAELIELGRSVWLHSSMEGALNHLAKVKPTSAFDANTAAAAIQEAILPRLRMNAEELDCTVGNARQSTIEAFITESSLLALSFEVSFYLTAVGANTQDSWAVCEGQCLYDEGTAGVNDLKFERVTLYHPDESGEIGERNHAFIYARAASGGRPPVPHQIREPMPGQAIYTISHE